jgi:hypothetical protein
MLNTREKMDLGSAARSMLPLTGHARSISHPPGDRSRCAGRRRGRSRVRLWPGSPQAFPATTCARHALEMREFLKGVAASGRRHTTFRTKLA